MDDVLCELGAKRLESGTGCCAEPCRFALGLFWLADATL